MVRYGGRRKRANDVLKDNPPCIFCSGDSTATTVDHQPARCLFDERGWPDGYAFPSCHDCNQASKDAEHKLALLVRIKSSAEDDPIRRMEFRKFLGAMKNNFPDLIIRLKANDKRSFLRDRGLSLPAGMSLSDMPLVGLSAADSELAIGSTGRKLLRALHWKHTGQIIPVSGVGIFLEWYTNAYFNQFLDGESAEFFRCLPAISTLKRNGKDISDQFGYRYGVDEDAGISAFLIQFRQSLLLTGIVAPESLMEAETE